MPASGFRATRLADLEIPKIDTLIERGKSFRYAGLLAFLIFAYAVGLSKYISLILSEGKSGGAVIDTPLDLVTSVYGVVFRLLCHDPYSPGLRNKPILDKTGIRTPDDSFVAARIVSVSLR